MSLQRKPDREAAEPPVQADDPVAGDNNKKWIPGESLAHAPVSFLFQFLSDGFIRPCFPVGSFSCLEPDFSLEWGSVDKVKR